MGFASRLGPWLLGTVKNTTGTTAGTVRNMGPTIVCQTFKRDYSGVTTAGAADIIACIPAGSQIVDIFVDTLVAFTGSTAANVKVGDGTTADLYVASEDATALGRMAVSGTGSGSAAKLGNWAGAATSAAPAGAGVGTTDVLVTATLTPTVATATAGTIQYTILYSVRNSDGSANPSPSQQ